MNKPMTYDYSIYQIENGPVFQTPEYLSPVCGFVFASDAREFCKILNGEYPGLRFIYTGMDKDEL